jgi:Copper amine oxidase N-terminal domain.
MSVLLLTTFCASAVTVGAEETPITVVIDGATIDFGADQTPVLTESGRTLVPMRKIFESMGASLNWVQETNTVTATKGAVTIVLKINENTATKNGTEVSLDQPAILLNGRTMVPVRFIGEALGAKVEWIAASRTVRIDTEAENILPTKKSIKILAIGNSFSQDATKYVHAISAADDVDVTIVNLYIGGCSLKTHWTNATNDTAEYSYELNGVSTGKKTSIKEALESDTWDFVTMQQVSQDSGKESTYFPYIENLATYIKGIEPQAKLLIHQTWAYEKGSPHSGFPYYNSDQGVMFDALKSAYDKAAEKVGLLTLEDGSELSPNKEPLKIIPCGKAFQNARKNSIFDNTFEDGNPIRLNRDGYHASLTYGRYLLGAVWYECITGNKIATNNYCPSGISENELALLKQAAHLAVVEYGWQSAS